MPRATPTPLLTLLRACSDLERTRLAVLAGTTVNYLYSLAGCHRGQPTLKLGLDIAKASETLSLETGGRTPIVSAEDLATMCAVSGLNG